MTAFDKFCVVIFPIGAFLVTISAIIDKQPLQLGMALLLGFATFNIYKKYNQPETESNPEGNSESEK